MIHPSFTALPPAFQQSSLELIQRVNHDHLHCNDIRTWQRVHLYMTEQLSMYYIKNFNKQKNAQPAAQPDAQAAKPAGALLTPLSSQGTAHLFNRLYSELMEIYRDSAFINPVMEALQQHILSPLSKNAELACSICNWIILNAIYLPLGVHLLPSFQEDMAEKSDFAKCAEEFPKFPEALNRDVEARMHAFLADTAQAFCKSYVEPPQNEGPPTAVVLSVNNGAGGHTAPHRAMEARLKELGWRVATLCYDTDFLAESDPFQLLGITFADGTPMTSTLYETRWNMQKQCEEEARIVRCYVEARAALTPDLFQKESGGDLLRRQVLPLNPKLIVTTMAYHWSWRSLAYRVPAAKTILVASDVFFHSEANKCWLRQRSLPKELRQIHFTTMTDDLELLKDLAYQTAHYYKKKDPGTNTDVIFRNYRSLVLDEQITYIGAPVNPAFKAVTSQEEIQRLKEKWNVPEGALSVCISRGKLGYDSDLIPALEGYRTKETLPKPLVLQVVCGENEQFYKRLIKGEFNDLGPNITIAPHPLRTPSDFAELRSISIVDDIKAGGGSTFEGWYLISNGAKTMLLLTPGPDLYWEGSNCVAMEKWGVGRTVSPDTGKIEILKELIEKGLPQVTNPFPDWKKPFDKLVERFS